MAELFHGTYLKIDSKNFFLKKMVLDEWSWGDP